MPPPDLRDRTLATSVRRASGDRCRSRRSATAARRPPADAVPGRPRRARPPAGAGGRRWSASSAGSRTIAAAVVLSVVTTSLIVGARVDDQLAAQDGDDRRPRGGHHGHARGDRRAGRRARRARRASRTRALDGSLVFSPSTTELVVVADRPRPSRRPACEYRCWVEVGRTAPAGRQDVLRRRPGLLGRAGRRPCRGCPARATFGVSLVGSGGSAVDAEPRARRPALILASVQARCRRSSRSARRSPSGGGASRYARWSSEQPLGGLGRDVVPVLGQDRRQPGRLARSLDRVDVGLAPARVHDDEPDQPGSDDEPDDEQPHVELGIHPRASIGSRAATLRGCSTSPRIRSRSSSARSPSTGTGSATRSAWPPPTWSWSGWRGGPARTRTSSATG